MPWKRWQIQVISYHERIFALTVAMGCIVFNKGVCVSLLFYFVLHYVCKTKLRIFCSSVLNEGNFATKVIQCGKRQIAILCFTHINTRLFSLLSTFYTLFTPSTLVVSKAAANMPFLLHLQRKIKLFIFFPSYYFFLLLHKPYKWKRVVMDGTTWQQP